MRHSYVLAAAAILCASACFDDPSGTPGGGETNNGAACDADVAADQKVGQPCSVETDSCPAQGTYVCTADGSSTECDAEPVEPTDEVCDGLDNDCDGEVDEGFDVGAACTAGVGACETTGALRCTMDGTAVCDAEPGTAGEAEICGDGIDNDCDGELDEGFETLGEECTSGVGVCEATGVLICSEDGLALACDALGTEPTEADEVTCDGLDNDCDGEVDEGCDDDADGYCDAGMEYEAAAADSTCPQGGGDCDDADDAINPGAAPSCDMKDTNCDGEVDNLLPIGSVAVELSAPLDAGVGGSPILVAPGDDGFCVVYNGKPTANTSRYRGYYSSLTSMLTEASTGGISDYPEDLLFEQGTCVTSIRNENVDNTIDGELERWTKNLATTVNTTVLPDGLYSVSTGTYLTGLASNGTTVVLAYMAKGSLDAFYLTVPVNFAANATPTAPHKAGLWGQHPVLGLSPTAGEYLFMARFGAQYNAARFTVGLPSTATSTLSMSGSSNRRETTIETVGGVTFLATRIDSATPGYELREIQANLDYGRVVTIPTGPDDPAEYINRRLFTAAPAPALATFANPVDDRLQVVSDDGVGGLSHVDVVDDRGDLLGVRDAGNGVIEAVWMNDPGDTAAPDNATLEVVRYTCH